MPLSIALQRLLHIRELQEEHTRSELKDSLRELERLHVALAAARTQAVRGRNLVNESFRSGGLTDRIAGLEEEGIANRLGNSIAPTIAITETTTTRLREQYLAARIQRRQAETLVRDILRADSVNETKGAQSDLDEWFRSRSGRSAQRLE